MIQITFPDGAERAYEPGASGLDIARAQGRFKETGLTASGARPQPWDWVVTTRRLHPRTRGR